MRDSKTVWSDGLGKRLTSSVFTRREQNSGLGMIGKPN